MSLEIDKSTSNAQNSSDKTIAEAYDATFGRQEHYQINNEGGGDEPFETVYLNEEEIEKFMANYMQENPGTEIETRYIDRDPVDVPQNIEVRWLRPTTPDIPPIIIQEVNVVEKEEPPIKIVQRRSHTETEAAPPIVIREKPNDITVPELKTIYLPTILKKSETKDKDIKIEHVRSDSQTQFDSRLVYDDQVFDEKKKNSFVDYEEAFETQYEEEEEEEEEEYKPTFSYKHKRSIKEEQEIQLYEEKLMQTLYEEYLLKLERERLERKLSTSGIFEERIRERERERSISQERSMSQSQRLSSSRFSQTRSSNRFSQSQVRINEEQLLQDEEIKMQRLRDEEFRQHQQRMRDDEMLRYSRLSRQREEEMRLQRIIDENYRQQQSNRILRDRQNSYKINPNRSSSITNAKVTDENELNRWNQIMNSPSLQNKVEAEQTLSSILNPNITNKNEPSQKYNNDYYSMRSSSYEKSFDRA